MNEQKTVTFTAKSFWDWIEKIMWTILTVYFPYELFNKVIQEKVRQSRYKDDNNTFNFLEHLVEYCHHYSTYFIIVNFIAITLIANYMTKTEKSSKFAKILFFVNIAVIILIGILNKLYVGD
jgi:hypothetical protein